jgi:hypothetical protein
MTRPRSGYAAPPQGGTTRGPAKPFPRWLLDAWPLFVAEHLS